MSNERDYCFGQPSSTVTGLVFGIIIILVGLTELFGDTISWLSWDTLWPYLIIILGLAIVGNSLYKRK
ncbi:MAG: hypothetical protein ACTSW1_08895 [Candidatus Hodarchaeales archaeon]|jgi:tetrahydromethanopterin S-methyltransferase subunit E